MDYAGVIAPVSRDEALAARCPRCLAAPGERCTYTSERRIPRREPGWMSGVVLHREGDPMTRAHNERNAVIRRRREREWKRDSRPARRASPGIRAASAAMREWDRREFAALRAWLLDYGYLLVNANLPRRPGGTLRGGTYTQGQD